MTEDRNVKNFFSNAYFTIGMILIILATTLIIISKYPHIWYTLDIHSTEGEIEALTNPIEEDYKAFKDRLKEDKEEDKLPPIDPELPEENTVKIPKIGVNTTIYEGENYEELLKKGAWRVPNLGTPKDNTTMILSAHRFGYIFWSDEERTEKSFYNLPSTREGDRIKVIWNQRKYEYEIYNAEETREITDADADLILYTCKLYNSPIRIFRYADRVE